QPSACVSYNASTHSVTVESSTGLVRIFTYDGNGLTARKLSKGSTGTQYWLEKLGYTSESLGDHEERKLLASRTVFREENTTGTGGETTTFDYTFHSGTLEIETLETTYPVVGSSENGPGGTALTRGRTFNTSGQLVWARDENGSITYREYDEKLGLLVREIVDLKTTGFSPSPPSGFDSATGLSLEMTYAYAADGKLTSTTDAANRTSSLYYTRLSKGEPVTV